MMKNKKRKITISMLALAVLVTAYISAFVYEADFAYIAPQNPREDITLLTLKKATDYSDAEFKRAFMQTGLGRSAVMSLSDTDELISYQRRFFTEPDYRRVFRTPFFCEEYVDKPTVKIVPVEKGDVLVTCSSHVMTWRNGHAAIVTDAESGKTLEAVVIGKPSSYCTVKKWEHYPNFKLLRLKDAPAEVRSAAADIADRYFDELPYNLLAGIYPPKYCEASRATGTQCAHLVWLAYASVGYDIDSNGGLIVTPDDISESTYFEVVQTYG